jgi:hypothetical protein
MAAISVNTGGVYHEDRLADTPREQWPALLRERRMYIETQFEYDCRCIVQYLAEAEDFYQELGYDSADQMIHEELLIKPEWVRIAVDWLKQEQRPEPVTKSEVELALRRQGRPPKGQEIKPTDSRFKYGSNPDYLKARIRRDAPEVADALDRGEFKSARAAAIEAGIIKPVPTIRLVSDIRVVAAKLCQHLTPEQRHALAEALLS